MNKTELASAVAEKADITKKDATRIVEAVFDTISGELAVSGKVSIVGFGNFTVRDRAARTGRNPITGEEISIAAKKAPAWKPSANLKDIVK